MAPRWLKRVFGLPASVRGRWDAAKTNRLNSKQWGDATGSRINADIAEDGTTLANRCQKELARNPTLEGICDTFCTDLIGTHGPAIAIESDNTDYNDSLEQIVKEFFKNPDINRQKSFAEFLEVGIRNCFTYGDLINLIVSDPDRSGPVKFSLQDIQPTRLATPYDAASRPDIICGIEVVKPLRPVAYHIMEVQEFGAYAYMTGSAERVPAENVLHWYRHIESEQIRGIPWFAVCLQVAADIRDYDDEVLDCARAAADTGIYLYTNHPDAPFYEVNETYQKERRQTEHVAPGWQPMQIHAEQPTTQYVDYRSERQRDLGRPFSMPLIKVRLDSSEHNYSSARFDGQGYQRVQQRTQYRLSERYVDPLVWRIALEAERAGELRPRPQNVEAIYTWPVMPHVDPTKEREATETGLIDMTLSLQDALAAEGKDLDTHMQKLKAADAALTKTLGIGLIEYIKLIQRVKEQTNGEQAPTGKAKPSTNGGGNASNGNGNAAKRFSLSL